jgi:hypothetical protein
MSDTSASRQRKTKMATYQHRVELREEARWTVQRTALTGVQHLSKQQHKVTHNVKQPGTNAARAVR